VLRNRQLTIAPTLAARPKKHFHMDTDDLSRETYRAIIVEAEKFNHDLTLRFGLLSGDCKDELEFIDKSEQLISGLKKVKLAVLTDIFFGNAPSLPRFNKTLDKISYNINKVKQIPFKKRHFDF
jgi:hypothetical protein